MTDLCVNWQKPLSSILGKLPHWLDVLWNVLSCGLNHNHLLQLSNMLPFHGYNTSCILVVYFGVH